MRIPFPSLSFITFVINIFIVVTSISPSTVIIDLDKGFVLQHVGTYAEKLEESIFHMFIPYNDLCEDSSNSNVCSFIQSTKPNMVEIGTIMSHSGQMPVLYNRQNISNLIQEDMQRTFLHHQVNRFLEKTKSIVFFMDNRFYVSKTINKSTTAPSIFSVGINQRTLAYRAMNPATLVLEQFFNNKVGYDFLSDEQIKELLSLTVSAADTMFDTINVKENIDKFANLIVGQSVFALKSCSLEHDDNSRSRPCLVVSTMFRRIPIDSSISLYEVYRLIPLPVPFKGEKYIYTDLPKIFGFNKIDKKVVLWNDDKLSSTCIFSRVVQCHDNPIIIPISNLPCLNELLSIEPFTFNTNCQVVKSKCNQVNILNIKSNIWYLYSLDQPFECESQSLSAPPADVISIKDPMIAILPCGRPIQCANIRLPPTTCDNTTVILKSQHTNTMNKGSASSFLFNNITDRLVSLAIK